MPRCIPPAINVRKVLERFGGAQALVALSRQSGFDMNTAQVRKWIERGVIPMARWLELRAMADRAGWSLVLEDFLEGEK